MRPEVKKNEVPSLDGTVVGGGGFVVGVAGVGIDCHVGDIGDCASLLQEGVEALLDAVFVEGLVGAQLVAEFLKEGVLDGDDATPGFTVGVDLFVSQLGFESLCDVG